MSTEDDLDLAQVLKDIDLQDVPPEEKLKTLGSLVRDQLRMTGELERMEELVVAKKLEIKEVSEHKIPDLFDELGIDEFRLSNGVKVQVKPYYSAKIEGPEPLEWLADNDYGDLIKGVIVVSYPKGYDQTRLQDLVKKAQELGLTVENQESVHHSTLKAWVGEMIKHGREFPRELFKVYVGRITKLSLK